MMKCTRSTLLLSALLLLAASSCSEEQLRHSDQVFGRAKAAGQGLQDAAHGPASPLIPDPVQAGLELAGVALIGAYGLWQRIRASKLLERHQNLQTTADQVHAALSAVADGIDQAGANADPVKAQIEQVMKDRHIYDSADRIVDGARISKSFN